MQRSSYLASPAPGYHVQETLVVRRLLVSEKGRAFLHRLGSEASVTRCW